MIVPVNASACKIPTEAAELWIIPVTSAPINTPISGFLNAVRTCANSGISASGATASLISFMPYINIAKPIKIEPILFFFCFLLVIIRRIPINAKISEKFSGFKSLRNMLLDSSPTSDKSHAVSVVPTLEPIIIPTDCSIVIIPELTSPTNITVVAEDDWIAIVIPAPSSKLLNTLSVIDLSSFSSLPPAIRSSPVDMILIPYRKNASPPATIISEKISILSPNSA